MQFDPTYNYGDADLSIYKNLVYWQFGELIKNLITLSSTAERQNEIIGYGAICDEMAIDFDTYFTLCYKSYIDYDLLNQDQVDKLKELDIIFSEHSANKSPSFWDDFFLATNQDWQNIRQKAEAILKSLKIQDITLVLSKEEKQEKNDDGRYIIVQIIKTKLTRKY